MTEQGKISEVIYHWTNVKVMIKGLYLYGERNYYINKNVRYAY